MTRAYTKRACAPRGRYRRKKLRVGEARVLAAIEASLHPSASQLAKALGGNPRTTHRVAAGLVRMGVVEKTPGGLLVVRAKVEAMRAGLPFYEPPAATRSWPKIGAPSMPAPPERVAAASLLSAKSRERFAHFSLLAKRIAVGFARRLPSTVHREDIEQAAMLGLWKAIERGADLEDAHFENYVRTRISGAIRDELRTQDWLSRRARKAMPDARVVFEDFERGDGGAAKLDLEEAIDARRAIEALNDRERELVEAVLLGEKQEEMACRLNVSAPRVSQLMNKARQHLAQGAQL